MSLFSDVVDIFTPGVGSLISGGLGFLGQMNTNQTNQDIAASNSAFNAEQAGLNRDFQADQAQKQMDFQAQQIKGQQDYETMMSNSAYQRATADLKAAGLNPMLAYMKGGASTPSVSAAGGASGGGSSAVAQNARIDNPLASAVNSYSQFSSASQAQATEKQIDATVDKIKAETQNIPIEGDRLKFAIQLLADDAALAAQKGETEVSIRKRIAAEISKIKAETTLLDFDVNASKQLDGLGAESKQFKVIVDLIRAVK